MLSPTIYFLALNAVIDALLLFSPLFVLTVGRGAGAWAGPKTRCSSTWCTCMMQHSVRVMEYGTALAIILAIIGVVLVFIMMKLEERFVFYESEQ
jgi:ABC-type sugar transport system permease subunit